MMNKDDYYVIEAPSTELDELSELVQDTVVILPNRISYQDLLEAWKAFKQ